MSCRCCRPRRRLASRPASTPRLGLAAPRGQAGGLSRWLRSAEVVVVAVGYESLKVALIVAPLCTLPFCGNPTASVPPFIRTPRCNTSSRPRSSCIPANRICCQAPRRRSWWERRRRPPPPTEERRGGSFADRIRSRSPALAAWCPVPPPLLHQQKKNNDVRPPPRRRGQPLPTAGRQQQDGGHAPDGAPRRAK